MNMIKFPDFYITGTVKGGTTSLYNYLYEHPDIYMCPVKEPHFFSTDIDPSTFREQYRKMVNVDIDEYIRNGIDSRLVSSAFVREEKTYLQLFGNVKPSQIMGESSTSYLISKEAASNIYKRNPDAKIIIMLRDPVKRAYSHYLMNYRSGSVKGAFQVELEKDMHAEPKGWGRTRLYADHGFYYEQVKRYLDIFGADKVKIILNEDLSSDTAAVVQDTYSFLGVNPDFHGEFHERHNSATIPVSSFARFLLRQAELIRVASKIIPKPIRNSIYRNMLVTNNIPQLDDESKKLLVNIYKDDTKKLQDLIGRDLSHWLK
jgi:Sulfotransferase family